ncbi:unnamed protein product [Closterium sp. NIES-53]
MKEFGTIAELVDFAAACRLDYAASLIAEYESDRPPSVEGECALGMDVLEDRQEDFECFAAAVPHLLSMLIAPEGDSDAPDISTPHSYADAITDPYSSQWQTAIDAEMASLKSTGTYLDAVPPPGANIFDGVWIFRVKRPPGSSPAFKARYVARGFNQREGVDFFQTFSPTPKMTTLRVLLHVAAQRDYELHSLDFSTAFLQGSLHEEIWLRSPHGFTGSFLAGTQWSLWPPVYGLRQAPREWHGTQRTTLVALGFAPSTANLSLFLRTDMSLPPFYVLMYITRDRARRTITLTQSHMVHHVLQRFRFRTSGMGLVLGGRGPVVLTGHADASWVDDLAIQWSSQGYTFSIGSGFVSWWSTHSSSVLSSSYEAEIYAGAMAAQELRFLTYLLTDLGERPRSSLCGQLRLAYVATWANTADIFTKALQSGDHQRFCTVLGLDHPFDEVSVCDCERHPYVQISGLCKDDAFQKWALDVYMLNKYGMEMRTNPTMSRATDVSSHLNTKHLITQLRTEINLHKEEGGKKEIQINHLKKQVESLEWEKSSMKAELEAKTETFAQLQLAFVALKNTAVTSAANVGESESVPQAATEEATTAPQHAQQATPSRQSVVAFPAPPPPPSPTTAAAAEGGGGVAAVKPAALVARETVAPVAHEPVAPVAREPVAPVARESVAPAAQS